VVAIIEADADELRDLANASPEPRIAVDHRQAAEIELAQRFEPAGEMVAPVISG